MHKKLRALLIVSLFFVPVGCADDEFGGDVKTNQPPTVWLSGRPPEGSLAEYRLHLFWGGWDPDGEIAYYEWLVTDNETGVFDPCDTAVVNPCDGDEPAVWKTVVVNDSIYQFTADVLADSTNRDRNSRG